MPDSSVSNAAEIGTPIVQEEGAVHEALKMPTQPKSVGFQIIYALANAVIGFGDITFYTILLPARIAIISPANQTNTFILISALSAIASVLTNPIAGAFSDRTTLAMGRRRPYLILALALIVISMLGIAWAPGIALLTAGSILLHIAINILLASLSAIIPDQVPLQQRATISALSGMAPLFGGLVGVILAAQIIRSAETSFYALTFISAIVLLIFIVTLRETRLPRGIVPAFRPKDLAASFWVNPARYPDFALTWGARCLVFLGFTTVVNYMSYFLKDAVHYTRLFPGQTVAQGVQIFFMSFAISLIAASIIVGMISDKLQRRKTFVIVPSLIMAVGLLLYAFFPLWTVVVIASIVLGIGSGAYLGVDLALATQVLPAAHARGKDLGIINTAIFLPMLVAPVLASIALDAFHSYAVLFATLAAATVIAALLIIPIKTVR